MKVVCSCFA